MKFVKIPGKNFEILEVPVTQLIWKNIMGTEPSFFKEKPNNPVESVSQHDIQECIKKLNKLSKKWIYSLPTEEEWEYCCRAGTITDFSFGDDKSIIGDYAWFYKNSNNSTQPVKLKKCNDFGLYDMHGNVWEWCKDLYDPLGSDRVLRGGSWYSDAGGLRSAERYIVGPGGRSDNVGFRLVRTYKTLSFDTFTLNKKRGKEAITKIEKMLKELKDILK